MIDPTDGKLHVHVFSHAASFSPSETAERVSSTPEVAFVGQFLGAFQVYAHLKVDDLQQAMQVVDDMWSRGLRTESSLELKVSAVRGPKRASPAFCALVRIRPQADPFVLLDRLDEYFAPRDDLKTFSYGAAVVSGRYDLLVDLGSETLEELERTVREDLQGVEGVGKTETSWADLRKNAFRNP
jgi:hypothetical protein